MIKIGIVTFHRANNYGAILQAYALYMKLRSLGEDVDVEVININYKKREYSDFIKYNFNKIFPKIESLKNYRGMKKFLNDDMALSPLKLISSEGEAISYINERHYDLVVTGSDEVWKKNAYLHIPNFYWLPKEIKTRKASFAATANRTSPEAYTDSERLKMKEALDGYDLITVRDDHTRALIEGITQQKVHKMCDPTFLIDFEAVDIKEKVLKANIDLSKPVIGFMGTYPLLVEVYKDYFGNAYEYISFYQHVKGTKFIKDLNPIEFVSVFPYCQLVVTSFFHGTIFSILNGVPFISLEMKSYNGMESKIVNLLKDSGLESRYFVRDTSLDMSDMIAKSDELMNEDHYDYRAFVLKQREKFDVFDEMIGRKIGR